MAYQDDKRELLKLKQGLIEESEVIKEEKPEPIKLTIPQKIGNFFYHNKFYLLAAAFFIAVVTFLVVDLLLKEVADIRVLYISSDSELAAQLQIKQKKAELAIEQYCPDFDDNGNVHCELYFIDNSENVNVEYQMAYQAKMYGEYSSGVAQMFIADKATIEELYGEDDMFTLFTDLSAIYPDNPNIDGIYYKLKDTDFAKLCGWDKSCPDDLYIVIRTVEGGMTGNEQEKTRNHARALTLLDNIISGTLQGTIDTTPFLQ